MTVCYIGIGSNLGDSIATVHSALKALEGLPDTRLLRVSQLYGSAAVGPGEQPDYVNGAAQIATQLSPLPLLDALQHIENTHQRVRGSERWTARTLDLDLLFYGDQTLSCERLQVPHPRIQQRHFVLTPLYDLEPNLRFPDGTSVADLVQQIGKDGITPLAEYPAYSL